MCDYTVDLTKNLLIGFQGKLTLNLFFETWKTINGHGKPYTTNPKSMSKYAYHGVNKLYYLHRHTTLVWTFGCAWIG